MDAAAGGELRLKACTHALLQAEIGRGKVHAQVKKLCVAGCEVTDACLDAIAQLFPNLEELYAQGTPLSGQGIDKLLASVRCLNTVALDGSAITAECANALLAAINARAADSDAASLTVSLLGVGELDVRWSKLLDAACNGRTAARFRVLTDLQKPFGHRPRCAIQVHDTLAVHVHLSSYPPFCMTHYCVPALRPVSFVAKDVVTELNLVADGDCRTVGDLAVAKRRAEYRRVFETLYEEGFFFSLAFRVGSVRLETLDLLTGTLTTQTDVSNKLMGRVDKTKRLTVHVTPSYAPSMQAVP